MVLYGCGFATEDAYVSEWGFKTEGKVIEKAKMYTDALSEEIKRMPVKKFS